MQQTYFPVIDPVATGENIVRLRKDRGLSVRDIQAHSWSYLMPLLLRALYRQVCRQDQKTMLLCMIS